ncbi:hypothetical protein TRFO_02103 [Tritrichomonas foetus]|uniref:Uncharacterized protein n=1 Tax=Tritrichomonas foetus TaxID=1144522 RepID=A0A1J4JCM5_9EUKA|nr:hypothetical protein TRFO_02103 [Tritrichomonas foetus]|eukprot:OHS96954.1 hypothetical protein TRFO_02103 [Tritrichomonas foetus]
MDAIYKRNESFNKPNRIKLSLHESEESYDKEEVKKLFLINLELIRKNDSIPIPQIITIFHNFLGFLLNFPNEIKNYFDNNLCNFIRSLLKIENGVDAIKITIEVIGTICTIDCDYVRIFSENHSVETVIELFNGNTEQFFTSTTYFISSLMGYSLPQTLCYIIENYFSHILNYAYAFLANNENLYLHVLEATNFIMNFTRYTSSLNDKTLKDIFEVTVCQINAEIPNEILLRSLWTYEFLLKGYSNRVKAFLNVEIIERLCMLLEDGFGEIDEIELDPTVPLLSIFTFLFKFKIPAIYFNALKSCISFPLIFELTSHKNINICKNAFGIIKMIIIHHLDLINELTARGLFLCLEQAFSHSFSSKTAAYDCISQIIMSKHISTIYCMLLSNLWVVVLDYATSLTISEITQFLKTFLSALNLVEQYGKQHLTTISTFFTKSSVNEILEILFNEQPEELVQEIYKALNFSSNECE